METPYSCQRSSTGVSNYNLYLGNAERAAQEFQRALRLSPLDPIAYRTFAGLSFACLFRRRFDEAVQWGTKAIEANTNFAPTHRALAASLAQAGRTQEAEVVAKQLIGLVPGLTLAGFTHDTRFRHPPDFDLLIEGMRKAGLPE